MILSALVALTGCQKYPPLNLTPLPLDQMATVHEISSSTIDSAGVKISKNTEFASEESPLAVVAKQNLAVIQAHRDVGVADANRPLAISSFRDGSYGYSSWGGFWGGRRIDSPRISRWGRNINPPPDMAPRVRRRP